MDENSHAQTLAGLENGEEFGRIQIPIIDVATYLDAFQTDGLATLQFLDRTVRVLHWKRAQAFKSTRIALHDVGDVVI